MKQAVLVTLMAFSTVVAGSAGDISKVNGSIRVDSGETVGDVSTVNGSIVVGSAARVGEVETVNGAIDLEDKVSARSVSTVNGGITLGSGVEVAESVSTVNGALSLDEGAHVGGKLETVNGKLSLERANVGGDLETVNGDIYVGAGSHVDGAIHVTKISGWSLGTKPRAPRITIGPGAVVKGPLHFEREVELAVSETATVGPVQGVPPKRVPAS